MFIRCFKFSKNFIIVFFILIFISCFMYSFALSSDNDTNSNLNITSDTSKSFIKWVDFNVSYDALNDTSKLDISSHSNDSDVKYNWIELLAFLACKNGGNFKYYDYFFESYSAILSNFIGNFSIEKEFDDGSRSFADSYGLKAFLPIAKGYNFSHYDDFGNSRSYGFKRTHLGNDLMGSVGTPVVSVESGVVEHLGWNQYGGWRIGIRSFDGKRYYYYAHLRKNHPYAKDLKEGDSVKAGDVIGYLGMTGYSLKENVNNINVPHLHFGLQLIFDESQIDSPNEIWIDVYNIIEFLKKNQSAVYVAFPDSKDYSRKFDFNDALGD